MKKIIPLLLLILFISCHSEKKQEYQANELLETDLAFSAMSEELGVNHAFMHFCAREGVLLRENTRPVEGQSSVIKYLANINDDALVLTWEPLHARVAKSGELGYTYGIYELVIKESGKSEKGTYVSIWTKQDQEWKWVLDSGNQGLGE